MINRGVSKTSQYHFNADTGMLEKLEENVQTIESLSNKMGINTNNIDDITKESNKNEPGQPINNITVITADDNLIHNYFYSMDVSWDASNCLSTAIIKMPKMDTENTNYWTTYTGQLTIYAGYNFTYDYVNQNSHPTEKDAANSLTKYWDNSDIKPFFRGEISRVKEIENEITIYVDSIGRRFQQKIPDDFRQAYIFNQNVRDAFQAICEFLGVVHICPPKTVTDDGETTTEDEETTTDGTENDVNSQIDSEKRISSQAKKKVKKAANKAMKDATKQVKNSSINQSNTQSATEEGVAGTESEAEEGTETEDELTNNQEIEEGPQNGYGDINFDANGAIVHGSTVIETSPDMAETLVAMDENPLEKYLEDETGIIEKVQKFLDGEMFDETHNKVMNYDAITIEPKSSSTSEMSNVGGAGQGGNTDMGSSSGDISSALNSASLGVDFMRAGNSMANSLKLGGLAKSSNRGKVSLSTTYIAGLSPAMAATMSKNPKYDSRTINLLRRRGKGLSLFYFR